MERNEKKARHYYELAALKGHVMARHNLGAMETCAGNIDRALKHFTIAAKDGNSQSLETIKGMYKYGDATKDEYAKALRSYQAYLDEIRSKQRDEAAASNGHTYYESVA